LGADDVGLVSQHPLPALCDFVGGFELFGELDEGAVVAVLTGPEAFVELLELGVFAGLAEEGETLAGAGFDEAGDHEAVDQLVGALAAADELVEGAGVGVGVGLGEATAATRKEAADDGEVLDFGPRDGGHRGDPVLGRVGLGPAVEQLEGVGGGFLLEVGVVVEQLERSFEDVRGPGVGRGVEEGEVDVTHAGWMIR